MSKYCFYLLLLLGLLSCLRTEYEPLPVKTDFLNQNSDWADSLLLQLDLEEKIGQLILLKANQPDSTYLNKIKQIAIEGKIGGVLLENLPLNLYADFIDEVNCTATLPLLNAVSQHSMINNAFSDQVPYPKAISIAATPNRKLEKQLFKEHLLRLQALQADMVLGLNKKPLLKEGFNTQLGNLQADSISNFIKDKIRSYEKDGILTVLENFDNLIEIENDTLHRLDSLLSVWKSWSDMGTAGIVIDTQLINTPDSRLRPKSYIAQYIRRHLQFEGLLMSQITDTISFKNSVHAGIEFFIVEKNASLYHQLLTRLVKEGFISEKKINQAVYKVLMAKAWRKNPENPTPIDAPQLADVFTFPEEKKTIRQLYESSIILAANPQPIIPLKTNSSAIRLVQVGKKKYYDTERIFKKYNKIRSYHFMENGKDSLQALKKSWQKTPIIVTINWEKFDSLRHRSFLQSLNAHSHKAATVVVNYGDPAWLTRVDTNVAIVQVFENNETSRTTVPQIIFGGKPALGTLPVHLSEGLFFGKRLQPAINRLAYVQPSDLDIDPVKLVGIDALMRSAISRGVTPGGQVMLIKKGKVFYHKSFGHHTYEKLKKVRNTDLYDIASLTKITATTLATMKAYENNQLSLNDRLSSYLPLKENKKLGALNFKKLLTHSTGLQANMPVADYILYKDSMNLACNKYFCKTPQGAYTIQIADSMYMHHKWLDTMWQEVYNLEPKRRKRFRYSDVNFNLIQKALEHKLGMSMSKYLNKKFYKSLGLQSLSYLPLNKYEKRQIVPTALDEKWRKQLIHGYVHDESAALLGGVAGNAGMFSNANDLGILFQMLLNGGTYGGQQYLQPTTIQHFTTAQYKSHRGLGFDTKFKRKPPSCGKLASKKTYGHTGFTGVCVWVDPKEELIYIFLSNRINPDVKNKKLFRTKLRSRIHDIVYRALR